MTALQSICSEKLIIIAISEYDGGGTPMDLECFVFLPETSMDMAIQWSNDAHCSLGFRDIHRSSTLTSGVGVNNRQGST